MSEEGDLIENVENLKDNVVSASELLKDSVIKLRNFQEAIEYDN